jgi:ring-1,2-phenylacetyl-CoA epoxidase subunit PaaC
MRPGAAHGARRLHPPPGRREHLGRAVRAITASNPDDKGELFDPAADKIYRHPTFYDPGRSGAHVMSAPSTTCCTWPTTPWCSASATPNGAATARSSKKTSPVQRQPRPTSARPACSQLAATLKGGECTEDKLAYFRDTPSSATTPCWSCRTTARWRLRASDRDYATTIVRNFLYGADGAGGDAEKSPTPTWRPSPPSRSRKPATTCTRDWLVRFGDGTDESARPGGGGSPVPYTEEFWTPARPKPPRWPPVRCRCGQLRAWDAIVNERWPRPPGRPQVRGYVTEGKQGVIPSTWASCSPRCRAWLAPIRMAV